MKTNEQIRIDLFASGVKLGFLFRDTVKEAEDFATVFVSINPFRRVYISPHPKRKRGYLIESTC